MSFSAQTCDSLAARIESTNELVDAHRNSTGGALDAVAALGAHFGKPVTIDRLLSVATIARQSFALDSGGYVVTFAGRTVVADVRVGNGPSLRAALTAFSTGDGNSGLEVTLPSACGTKDAVYRSVGDASLTRVELSPSVTASPSPDALGPNGEQLQQQTKVTYPGRT